MKCKHILTCKSSLKKRKYHELEDITKEDLEKAKLCTPSKPFVKKVKIGVYEMFWNKHERKVEILWYIGFEGFVPIDG